MRFVFKGGLMKPALQVTKGLELSVCHQGEVVPLIGAVDRKLLSLVDLLDEGKLYTTDCEMLVLRFFQRGYRVEEYDWSYLVVLASVENYVTYDVKPFRFHTSGWLAPPDVYLSLSLPIPPASGVLLSTSGERVRRLLL